MTREFAFFEARPGIALILQPDAPLYTIVAVSNDFLATSGRTKEEVIGRSHFDVFPENPEDLDAPGPDTLRGSFAFVLKHGKPHVLPLVRYDIPDGNGGFLEKYWKSTNAPVCDERGEVIYLIHTSEDVTALIKAERDEALHLQLQDAYRSDIDAKQHVEDILRSRGRRQSFLLQLNDHLRKLCDPKAIQFEAARITAGFLGADRIGFAEDGGDGHTVHIHIDYATGLGSLRGKYKYEDYGIGLIRSLREGRIVVRGDIARDPELSQEEKAAHAAIGLGATVNVPLLKDDRLAAIFFMHFQQPHTFTEEEVSLMRAVAERTWEAVMRARMEQALRQSEERFRIMVDTIPQSIWITDAAGKVEYLNRHWCDYCGVTYSETTAGDISVRHLHPDDGPKVMEAFSEAMQTGQPFEVEQRNRAKDGSYRWFLNRATPYRDPATGDVIKWFGVGIDIHDRKLAEEALRASEEALEKKVLERTGELEKANEELQRSNVNLEEFAYAASHDMKEPIRKIHFFADRLRERMGDSLNEEDRRHFDRLVTSARRMSTLIDDLLTYSHISRGVAHVDSVDLNATLELVLEDMELNIEELKARVTVDPLPTVQGHRRQLQQLFENLIGNALKYSRAGVAPEISVTASEVLLDPATLQESDQADAVRYHDIEVRDNGIGFAQADAERIFNVFTRLHTLTEYKGTGVGLSIVRKVAENHNGKVVAESSPGGGARFHIYLPAS